MKIKFLVILLFTVGWCSGQQTLSLQQAIDIAIQNNLGLKIVKNENQIASNNNSPGNAGMLPQISATSGATIQSNNIEQRFSNGTTIEKDKVGANNLNAGIALNYTFFDGMKMFATKQKLEVLQAMGENNLRNAIQQTIELVIIAYTNASKQKLLIKAINNSMELYTERVKIAEAKLLSGKSSKTELLQFQIDLNSQKNLLNGHQVLLQNAINSLNEVMQKPADQTYEVSDTLIPDTNLQLGQLLSQALSTNLNLQQLELMKQESSYSLKEIQSQKLPQLRLNAGYNFSRSANQQGFFLYNQAIGPNAGLGLSWNLYNGGVIKRQTENARIQQENIEMQEQQYRNTLSTTITMGWREYRNAISNLNVETRNLDLASENLLIGMERLRLGESNILEIKEAQKLYNDAIQRKTEALARIIIAQTSLLRWSAQLK